MTKWLKIIPIRQYSSSKFTFLLSGEDFVSRFHNRIVTYSYGFTAGSSNEQNLHLMKIQLCCKRLCTILYLYTVLYILPYTVYTILLLHLLQILIHDDTHHDFFDNSDHHSFKRIDKPPESDAFTNHFGAPAKTYYNLFDFKKQPLYGLTPIRENGLIYPKKKRLF